jgi:hypothetical protein
MGKRPVVLPTSACTAAWPAAAMSTGVASISSSAFPAPVYVERYVGMPGWSASIERSAIRSSATSRASARLDSRSACAAATAVAAVRRASSMALTASLTAVASSGRPTAVTVASRARSRARSNRTASASNASTSRSSAPSFSSGPAHRARRSAPTGGREGVSDASSPHQRLATFAITGSSRASPRTSWSASRYRGVTSPTYRARAVASARSGEFAPVEPSSGTAMSEMGTAACSRSRSRLSTLVAWSCHVERPVCVHAVP